MRRGTTARTSLRADEVLVDVLMLPPVGIGEFGPGPTPETRRIFSRGRRLDHRGGPPMTDRSHVAQHDAERQRLSALAARLSDQELARPLPAGWTVATVLGHVAFWDQRVIEIIAAWRRAGVGAPLPALAEANVDWINDAAKPFLLALPPRRTAELAVQIALAADQAVAGLPDEFVSAARAGTSLNLLRAEHRREHLDEIEAALGR